MMMMVTNEGEPKWKKISSYQPALDSIWTIIPKELADSSCSFAPVYMSLTDHKAKTLSGIVGEAQKFIYDPQNHVPGVTLSLAGGSAGIEAATNIVISQANSQMLYLV